jgi:hypothetical protein
MKKLLIITALFAGALLFNVHLIKAQGKQDAPKYEYATVKWDGPDRLFYNLPDKFELVHLAKVGVKIPNDAQEEEWCLAYASNKMATDGWEPVNLDSRRILFRRAK